MKLKPLKNPLKVDNLVIASKNKYWADIHNLRGELIGFCIHVRDTGWMAWYPGYVPLPIKTSPDLQLLLERFADYHSDPMAYVRDHPLPQQKSHPTQ